MSSNFKKFIDQTWKFILGIMTLALVAIWIAIPESTEICLVASGLWLMILVFFTWPRRQDYYRLVKSSYFKNLVSNLISIALLIGILGLINFMVFKRPISTDITKQKVNTLSDQTIKLISKLPEELKIELYAKRDQWPNSLSILELIRYHKHNLTIEAIDIEKELLKAKTNHIAEENSIRLIYKERSVVAALKSEISISNALIRLIRGKPYEIGFTKNHGEIELNKEGNEAINFFLSGLKADNHHYQEIDLSLPGRLEMDLIIIAGPRFDFDQNQIRKLKEFLLQGGKLLAFLDVNFEEDNLKNLRAFLKEWGIVVGRDVVVDKMSTIEGVDASIIMSKKFSDVHEITKNFTKKVVLPVSSSVEIEKIEGFSFYSLIYSTEFPASWAEKDLSSITKGNVKYEDSDLKGPVSLAVVSEKNIATNKKTRIAVFGTSRMLLDGYQGQSANYNFLMNTVSWLVEEDKIISLNRPALVNEQIFMSQVQLSVIFYFSIIVTPLLLIGLAIFFYKRKQRL